MLLTWLVYLFLHPPSSPGCKLKWCCDHSPDLAWYMAFSVFLLELSTNHPPLLGLLLVCTSCPIRQRMPPSLNYRKAELHLSCYFPTRPKPCAARRSRINVRGVSGARLPLWEQRKSIEDERSGKTAHCLFSFWWSKDNPRRPHERQTARTSKELDLHHLSVVYGKLLVKASTSA